MEIRNHFKKKKFTVSRNWKHAVTRNCWKSMSRGKYTKRMEILHFWSKKSHNSKGFFWCLFVCVCFVLACSCFGFPVLTPKLQFYEFIFYELCQVLQDKDDVLDCISWLQLWYRSVWIATIVLGLYNNFLASLNQNPGLPLQISQQVCLSICK